MTLKEDLKEEKNSENLKQKKKEQLKYRLLKVTV